MSDTIVAALIGAGALILVTLLTIIFQPYFALKWAQHFQPPQAQPAPVRPAPVPPAPAPLPQEAPPQIPPAPALGLLELTPARIAARRATGATLLDAATKLRQSVTKLENLQDNRASRLVAFWSFLRGRDLSREAESEFREVARELALEPNARLHKALDTFAEAEQEYFDALMRPFTEPANLRRFYFDQTPQSELDPLRKAADASWTKLKTAVGYYRAVGEQTATPTA